MDVRGRGRALDSLKSFKGRKSFSGTEMETEKRERAESERGDLCQIKIDD